MVRTFAFLISCYTSYDNTLQTLQHAATRCNTLQHTATHCITLHHAASHCITLQHMQHTATTQCSTLQYFATHCSTLQHPSAARHTCYTLQQTCAIPHILQSGKHNSSPLIIQVIFRKQAINYWSYLREMTLIMHDKGEES